MTKSVITITENQSLQETYKLMYQNYIGSIVILKSGDLNENVHTGIITERDITRIVGFTSIFSHIHI